MSDDFVGLTTALVNLAIDLATPAIDTIMAEIGVRSHGNLVVLDPTKPYNPAVDSHTDPAFEDVILVERQWGDPETWEVDFKLISRSKAFQSWVTGLPTHLIQQMAPFLYRRGWTKHAGSAVGEGGFTTSFSGIQGYLDRTISELVVVTCRGVCMHELHDKETGVMANRDIDFLGRAPHAQK